MISISSFLSHGRCLPDRVVLISFLAAAAASRLSAAVIVDTGPGSASASQWTLSPTQWLAGEFTVSGPVTVTSIEGWIRTVTLGSGSYIVSLADDTGPGGTVPGATLYSTTFATSTSSVASWQGASSLSWALPTGTYWVIFGSATGGPQGNMAGGAPTPLIAEASGGTPSQGGAWGQAPFIDIGVRIQGESVPDQGTTGTLFGCAVAGLIALGRTRLAAQVRGHCTQ